MLHAHVLARMQPIPTLTPQKLTLHTMQL